jgi:hypothetical protein
VDGTRSVLIPDFECDLGDRISVHVRRWNVNKALGSGPVSNGCCRNVGAIHHCWIVWIGDWQQSQFTTRYGLNRNRLNRIVLIVIVERELRER